MRKPAGSTFPAGLPGGLQATSRKPPLLLERLRSTDSHAGWEEFLISYSPVLYQTIRAFTREEDDASDCFVFICEQLAKNSFRRLLQFDTNGTASFTTWLRVVARNLCFDWHRKKHGRFRPFKSIQNLRGAVQNLERVALFIPPGCA